MRAPLGLAQILARNAATSWVAPRRRSNFSHAPPSRLVCGIANDGNGLIPRDASLGGAPPPERLSARKPVGAGQ